MDGDRVVWRKRGVGKGRGDQITCRKRGAGKGMLFYITLQ